MIQPFPHRYETTLVWEGGPRGAISSGSRPVLVGGPPPEFDGEPGWWSPEHLLLAAANLCLMTTYLAMARKAGLAIDQYRSDAEAVLEKTREGIVFTRITLRPRIVVSANLLDQARQTLEAAKKYCIVSHALKPPVVVDAEIEAAWGPAIAS